MELEDLKKHGNLSSLILKKPRRELLIFLIWSQKPIIKRDYYGVASSVLPFLW